ncbi:MAG: hypothetical protein HZC51_04550 [Nitrospirae bacterium]|nr:hypothetical protein [Nitrospirota bacterium]
MSRYFDVQVVFKQRASEETFSEETRNALVALATREVYSPESCEVYVWDDDEWRHYELEQGDVNLSGGMSTEDMDAKFRLIVAQEFPRLYPVTKWHRAEWEWDDVYDATEDMEEEVC